MSKGTLPDEFAALGERIRTQDNRITAHPLFVVFQKKRIYGIDTGYVDDFTWLNGDGDELDEKECRQLEMNYHKNVAPTRNTERVGYMDIDVFVTACFTEAGAEAYIAANGHNLKKPHIYVETLYRNAEMIGLREWLKALNVEQEAITEKDVYGSELGVAPEAGAGPSAVSAPSEQDAAAVPNAKPTLAPAREGEGVRANGGPEDRFQQRLAILKKFKPFEEHDDELGMIYRLGTAITNDMALRQCPHIDFAACMDYFRKEFEERAKGARPEAERPQDAAAGLDASKDRTTVTQRIRERISPLDRAWVQRNIGLCERLHRELAVRDMTISDLALKLELDVVTTRQRLTGMHAWTFEELIAVEEALSIEIIRTTL